jgi:antitoxin component of MazEF toxin-antitoxin module
MKCIAKLQKCGNATHVTIPKMALEWLGWLPGELVVFELLEEGAVKFRRINADETTPKRIPLLHVDNTLPLAR